VNDEISPSERRALQLLREHDPAASVRPGAAARIEARLRRPARRPRYVWALVLAAIAISTASFAARALFRPAAVIPPAPVMRALVEPVAVPPTRRSTLLEETHLLEQIAQELKTGRPMDALAGVEAHEKKFPSALLRLEALGFRVQAFEQLGAGNVTPAMADAWVAALSELGRCEDAARVAKQLGRAVKGSCAP
jgi:hypothetical protein